MDTDLFYKIIEYVEELCRGYECSVAGCEGCPMYWVNEEDNQECDLEEVIQEAREELRRL